MKLVNRVLNKLLIKSGSILSDKSFLQIKYWLYFGKKLPLDNPRTFNEKLNWLKIYNRKPEMTQLVDKIQVKDIMKKKIGEQYIIPNLGVWDNVEDIEWESLPDKFVIKTNHSGGNTGVIVVADKSKLNIEDAKRRLTKSLRSSIYKNYREWPYKNVQRKVFAEEYLCDHPIDYKFYCFNGFVDCVMVCLGRDHGDTKFYFFNKEWELLKYNKAGKEAAENFTLPKPENLEEMFKIASEISKGIPFSRIDIYNVSGKIFFGEITFYPASGLDTNYTKETEEYFGNLINLIIFK